MRCAVLAIAVVAVPGLTGPLHAQATAPPAQRSKVAAKQSPFVGNWVANLSKSKLLPNHQLKSATLRFSVQGDTVTLTQGAVNASGHEESRTITLQADGKEYPIPEAPGLTSLVRWVGSNVLNTVGKKDGEIFFRATYQVSTNGKTLTISTGAGGAAFDQVVVFDRK